MSKKKMKYHNSNSIPNEKVTEMLFMSYALVYLRELFPNMPISVFAPTLSEEFLMGYDARIIGKSHCFELFIQFKIPDLKNDIFAIKKTPHQDNILRRYPKRTAFYVAPTFKSYLELDSKQFSHLSAKDFLDNYVAVSVSSLTENMQRVGYKSDASGLPNYAEELVSRKRRGNGNELSTGQDWITGSDLFTNFIASKISISNGKVSLARNYSSANVGISPVNGSLCYLAVSSSRFGDEKPLRVYTADKIIERSHSQLMEYPDSPQDDSTKLSYWLSETSDLNIDYGKGGMMFRIYNPLDLDER